MVETRKYYDRAAGRLVYLRERATSDYWDRRWREVDAGRAMETGGSLGFFPATTARYLPAGARVLDGGCGVGDKVRALADAGFDAHGVDFASRTLLRARQAAPDLRLVLGDVRALPYGDASFDGCWSIGVIEHFYEGFSLIASEARRVLRPGGILFLTFPAYSPMRRMKRAMGLYPDWPSSPSDDLVAGFYQFALRPAAITEVLRRDFGFDLVGARPRGGLRGLKEEVPALRRVWRRIERARGRPVAWLRGAVDAAASRVAGHTALLVLRKPA